MDQYQARDLILQLNAELEETKHRLKRAKQDVRFWGVMCLLHIVVITFMLVVKI